jgi:single-strand selective monofunctional uracil DNA glycosylase
MRLIEAARDLAARAGEFVPRVPIAYVYNPLSYAAAAYEEYLRRFGRNRKRVILLGMNPGPWGMAQTGVPFGEVEAVRDWMGIETAVDPPARQHPARQVLGFGCPRSEVSGRRLWGLMRSRFGSASRFFEEHFVANYCPLMFLDARGRNITPDRLPAASKPELFHACDEHLRITVDTLRPDWAIGVGRFAERRLSLAIETCRHASVRIGGILHPSPANPRANRDWAGEVTRGLLDLGVWKDADSA